MPAATPESLLLLGPTGVGKTPLGDALDADGLLGRPCRHFDFGAKLRALARRGPGGRFDADDVVFVRAVLTEGALLEDERFELAARLFHAFCDEGADRQGDLVVLNGLPRHQGQAEAVSALVDLRLVVELRCEPAVVYERIRRDSGGDRAGRDDDGLAEIAKKLRLFEQRTRPILDWCARRGLPIVPLDVSRDSTGASLRRALERALGRPGVEGSKPWGTSC